MPKIAFRTHDGHYEFLVMPFGLKNAPSTFQATMHDTFRPFLRKFVLVFFDDILVYSSTWEEHLAHLVQILETLEGQKWVANRKKCQFGRTQVEYLGHIIQPGTMAMDPCKVDAIRGWPTPHTSKGVRGFLGLTRYYRRFVHNYGKIARPLTDLLKKDGFNWSADAQCAFEELKMIMTTTPVLALPNFQKLFTIECDASGKGVGAVLMQEGHPVTFFSKALSDQNLAKSTYEKELMALVLAVQHWSPYLLGRHFKVLTDQKALRHLLQQRISTPDQQQWLIKLLGYDYEVLYKAGNTNQAADALSRIMGGPDLYSLSTSIWQDLPRVLEDAQADPALQRIMEQVSTHPLAHYPYNIDRGRLLYKKRLVIPATSPWVQQLLKEFHCTASGVHSGVYRTYKRIAGNVY